MEKRGGASEYVLHTVEGDNKPKRDGEIWLCTEVREEKRDGGYPRIIVTLTEHMLFQAGQRVVCDFKKKPHNSPIPDWYSEKWKDGFCTEYVPDPKGISPTKDMLSWHCETVSQLSFSWERNHRQIVVRLISPKIVESAKKK